MVVKNLGHHLTIFSVLLAFSLATNAVWAHEKDNGPLVVWKRIEGVIVPGTAIQGQNLNTVAGVPSVGISWTSTRGRAQVNLQNGQVKFYVLGLVLAGQVPDGGLVIGTPSPAVTSVKGTIVCNASDPDPFTNVELVDTGVVPLSSEGNAYFKGQVELPTSCEDMAFLVRVGEGPLVHSWIAHGAVRVTKGGGFDN